MLENSALLVRRSEISERRLILAVATEVEVGFACWRTAESGSWWGLPRRRVLEVREQEDESLLCTVCRCWTLLPWFAVHDADDHFVGRFLGPVLQDRSHARCALRREIGLGKWLFLNPKGLRLASLHRDGDSLRLEFDELIEKEPFVKMLLLGFVIHHS